MSQDRPPSRNGQSKIINMNHVLMHSQMQYSNNNNNNNNNNVVINKNGFIAMEAAAANNPHIVLNKTSMPSIATSPATTQINATSMNNYITPANASTNGDTQNGVNGNQQQHHQIVLLANEKLEMSDSDEKTQRDDERKTTNDEELTSLAWLHDKNLLKGINLSCTKVQSASENGNSGRLSIISKSNSNDEKIMSSDDSGVSSVDNISLNSSNEQSDIYSSPASPKPLNFTKTDNNNSKSTINNNNSSTTIENAIKILDRNNSSYVDIIKVFPSQNHYSSSNLNSEESINQIIKAPQTPHTHFHKRYLREHTMKQQDEEIRQPNDHQSLNVSQLSYIIAKPQQLADGRFILSNNDDHVMANYNNNNNYESEYDLSTKAIDYAMPKASSVSNSSSSATSSLSSSPSPKSSQKPHPSNVPYDPLVHITSKPPYSFSSLIFMAIEDSTQKALPVKEIYAWIIQHFPYFKTAPTGWKNSVRHNLSLNKCFQKVEKAANLGKGSLWMVEPQYRPNLIQALTRSPFHPCSTWEKHMKNLAKTPSESPKSNGSSTRLPNPEHFPFLSRRLAAVMENYEEDQSRSSTPSTSCEMPQNYPVYHNNNNNNNNNSIIINGNLSNSEIFTRELNAETIDDVNAATAMLALKHGPKIFTEGISFTQPPIVTTTSPSEDHTYSIFGGGGKSGTDNNSNGTSSDAAYESSDENNVVYHFTQPLNEQEMEEQRKQAEGVDALLNLAGYNTNTTLLLKRPLVEDQQQQPQQQEPLQHFEKKQYFYTTEVVTPPMNFNFENDVGGDDEPPMKKSKSRMMKNKLKKKPWSR